jgi:hypothetical protein
MKLKAPPGVGDPCVAGVAIVARDGLYDVEAEIGALLIECFGFVETKTPATAEGSTAATSTVAKPVPAPRRRAPVKKTPAET